MPTANFKQKILVNLCLLWLQSATISMIACSGPEKETNGVGTFPDLSALAQQVAPVLPNASQAGTQLRDGISVTSEFAPATDWPAYHVPERLNDIFGKPDQDPKDLNKLYVLLEDLRSTIKEMNEVYWIVDDGTQYNYCQDVNSGDAIATPWYSAAGQAPFFSFGWPEITPYKCAYNKDNGKVYFSQIQVGESDRATCPGDPYTYHLLQGSRWARENAIAVNERGPGLEISQMVKAYYDACKKDLHVISAQALLYTSGIESRTRIELKGNVGTHEFSIRAANMKTEQLGENPSYFTTKGYGKSQALAGSEYFMLSFEEYEGTTATIKDEKIFCLSAGIAGSEYTAVDGVMCSGLEASFQEIPTLTYSQIPAGLFDANF